MRKSSLSHNSKFFNRSQCRLSMYPSTPTVALSLSIKQG
uniref:Uncharacterized protein n=1 Tax=Rhizophora mucronata TaxID=61149 RepID=A0A2P2NGH2_RHIMU